MEGDEEAACTCPITLELMVDPVIAADGFSYERHAISAWLAQRRLSPATGLPLAHTGLIPNRALRQIIMASGGGPVGASAVLRAALRGGAVRRRLAAQRLAAGRIAATVEGAATRRVLAGLAEPEAIERQRASLPVRLREGVSQCVGMVRDSATGRYRPSRWAAVAAVSAALVYLASPFDMVPDAIPVVGLADDAAVLGAVLGGVASVEMVRYAEWKKGLNADGLG